MSPHHNLTSQCGSETLKPWELDKNDFGECFFHLCIQVPVYSLLAVSSSYYIGKRRAVYSFYRDWNTCQSGLIYFRSSLVSLLIISCVFELMFRYSLFSQQLGFVEAAIVCIKAFSWMVHLAYILQLKQGYSFNTRGPKSMIFFWMLTALVSIIRFRSRYLTSLEWKQEGGNLMANYVEPTVNLSSFHPSSSYKDRYIWLWESLAELGLQGLYFLTLIPGSTHLEQSQYVRRVRHREMLSHAYEGEENNSFAAFDGEDDSDEFPLGVAKENVGFISNLLFLWVTPLIKKGACGFLKNCDNIFELPSGLIVRNVARQFQRSQIGGGTQLALINSLHKCYSFEFYSIGVLKLISDIMDFSGPILLNFLVRFIEADSIKPPPGVWVGYCYVLGLFITRIIGSLCNTHFNMRMAEVTLKIRTAIITSIYKKTVNLNKATLENFSSGEIINFMSTDTDRIVNFCPSFHAAWSLPIQVAVTLYLLYNQIGISFLAGLVFTAMLIPINRYLANKIGDLSTEMMKYKDQRVKLMSEILYGIKILKFHAWEAFFIERVEQIRKQELKSLKGRKYLDALCVYFWATTPVLVSVLSFSTYVWMGNSLTAAKVFTSIALFNMLISPLNALPWVINGMVEAWVSIKRINVLMRTDLEEAGLSEIQSIPKIQNHNLALVVENGTFSWRQRPGGFMLRDINLKIEQGQFIGVVGDVGSGKSSLLLALLGELVRTQGTCLMRHPSKAIGLVQQEPWIQRGTVRSNICFGPNTQHTKYKSVVESCCLQEDLNTFVSRDETLIGDNGLTLSGGQKVRLSLARAVYQNYDTYFLDDIFAAVDYKVAKDLYNRCLLGALKTKTRIVCTHHLNFLRHADTILVMSGGSIIDQGSPNEILPKLMMEDSSTSEAFDDTGTPYLRETGFTWDVAQLSLQSSMEHETLREQLLMNKSSRSFEFNEEPEPYSDVHQEYQRVGKIQTHVLKYYMKSVGVLLCFCILLSLTAMQCSRNLSDLWLAHWVSVVKKFDQHKNISHTEIMRMQVNPHYLLTDMDETTKYYFLIFVGIGILNSVFTLARAFLFAYGGINGARKIHSMLLTSILKAKMSFFDVTPIGRIINRFSTDVCTVDDNLPFTANILLAQSFGLIGTLIVTCYALPWILLVVIPLLLICNNIQEYYRHTARQLRRLSSISLSPVYAQFSETLKGLVNIRAMKAVGRFEELNENYLEASQKCQYATQAVSQWLNIRLQLIGVAVISGIGLIGMLQHHSGVADAGIIGLAISYALTVTGLFNGFVTIFTETEKELISVERVVEYIEEVDQEEDKDVNSSLPYQWPAQGVVEFSKVYLKYDHDSPYVLNNINFKTRPGEKIGIVGRTGSGKSSLFSAIARLVEISRGSISIDTVNIENIRLSELRSKLCIIPQDPLIFSGTLRENLDPLNYQDEMKIQRTIEKCHLGPLVRQLGGLDEDVGEGGNLLSTGQKQLVCLARAMLVDAKILCIDEATANVDQETDKLIQSTLRSCFGRTTIISIAHRVPTVLHCDRVIVMSQGEIVEMDDPAKLNANHNSLFCKLAQGNL